jgi:phosphate ABC transporter permease protein PstC
VLFLFFIIFNDGKVQLFSWFMNGFGTTYMSTSGKFGALAVLFSTVYVSLGSILFSAPISLFCAIFLADYADLKTRNIIKPAIEVLMGIPSIVIGIFGAALITRSLEISIQASYSVFAAWIILAIMTIPYITSISEDAIRAVPREYREASLALGATKWQTTTKIVIPNARSGIIASIILAFGRVAGETMAVSLVIGNVLVTESLINLDPLIKSNVITSLIQNEFTDIAINSPEYYALYALGALLLLMVATLNLITKYILRSKK